MLYSCKYIAISWVDFVPILSVKCQHLPIGKAGKAWNLNTKQLKSGNYYFRLLHTTTCAVFAPLLTFSLHLLLCSLSSSSSNFSCIDVIHLSLNLWYIFYDFCSMDIFYLIVLFYIFSAFVPSTIQIFTHFYLQLLILIFIVFTIPFLIFVSVSFS